MYTAIVLDDSSRNAVLNFLKPMIANMVTNDWNIICHHVTINLNNFDQTLNDFSILGTKQLIEIDSFAYNDKVVAVGVKVSVNTINHMPHITIAVNPTKGGKPKDSNSLSNWEKLPNSFIVHGIVTVVN